MAPSPSFSCVDSTTTAKFTLTVPIPTPLPSQEALLEIGCSNEIHTAPIAPIVTATLAVTIASPTRAHSMLTRSHDGTLPPHCFIKPRHPMTLSVSVELRSHGHSGQSKKTHCDVP